jgi:putative transposase
MNRPRFGYERIHIVLRREGWKGNRKRVHRLYRLEGLQVRMRMRPQATESASWPSTAPDGPG